MSIFLRQSRVALRISGPEAGKLLNDVLTATIKQQSGIARWWALLTPQGKIIAEGLISWHNDAFWLDVAADFAADFFKRMRMYKLRAKVEIEDLSVTHAVGWSEKRLENADFIVAKDIRTDGMGYRVIAPQAACRDWVADETEFAAKRIALGIGEMGADFAPNTMFPHDIGMDLLGGVDFKKGCYVGQEVVSRMHHRSTARRRPLIVSNIEVHEENSVMAGDREAGRIGQQVNGVAVGFLRLDRLGGAKKASIAAKRVILAAPEWASYDFSDSDRNQTGT
ncbi:tRNA-modifying protein YgfZ [hydrothermal vent metagenome]|uniref:tRNA-modifying protein YgfZ n=1 Tax=hydrothermal vent metagenome TaxID=652676 RepID=A0A3B0UF95_9ZZZZ